MNIDGSRQINILESRQINIDERRQMDIDERRQINIDESRHINIDESRQINICPLLPLRRGRNNRRYSSGATAVAEADNQNGSFQ